MTIELGGITELIYALGALVAAVSALLARRDARQVAKTVGTPNVDERTIHEALEHQDERLETLETKIDNGHGNGTH